MAKRGVLILECMDKDIDPDSEGRCLEHLLKLMEIEAHYIEVRTKHQLLSLMEAPDYEVIHISTHGEFTEQKKGKKSFKGLWTHDGRIGVKDLKNLKNFPSGQDASHAERHQACRRP